MLPLPIVDRLLALAPLGVLAYALHRHERERAGLLKILETDREAFRNERRELINRHQFPTAMPTATRPVDRRPPVAPISPLTPPTNVAEWARVGTVGVPTFELPGDGSEVPD